MNWALWIGLAAFYATVLIVLTLILRAMHKADRRKQCMMNHPAGLRARIAPSPIGQINETFPQHNLSANYDLHTNMVYGKIARGLDENSGERLSLEDFSSRSHHLEGD